MQQSSFCKSSAYFSLKWPGRKTSFASLCILKSGVTFTRGTGRARGLSSEVKQSSATGHSRQKENVKERKSGEFAGTPRLLHVQSDFGRGSTLRPVEITYTWYHKPFRPCSQVKRRVSFQQEYWVCSGPSWHTVDSRVAFNKKWPLGTWNPSKSFAWLN